MDSGSGIEVDIQVWTIIFRTLLTYLLILVILRIMGKREIGELSVLDLVVFVMLAEIAVFSIEEPDKSLVHALIPMTLLLLIQRLSAFLSLKSQNFREWFDGTPTFIIKHGKVDEYEMKKQRYNFNDLLIQLREKDIFSIQDVDYAILEPNGKLSVLQKDENDSDHSSGYSAILIADGKIQYDSLKRVKKNKSWLLNELKKKGYESEKNISFCSLDEQGELFIDQKNEYE
ncbi:YetF domain-containing protein [Halobacillus sp. MO56]